MPEAIPLSTPSAKAPSPRRSRNADETRQALPESLRERLRLAKLLATPNRLAVLSILAGHTHPTTVASIYLALQNSNQRRSLGTVYRTVGELLRHGLVQREWDDLGNSLYVLTPLTQPGTGLDLVCRQSRERRHIDDPALVARLMKLARECGMDILPDGIVIEVSCARND